MNVPHQAAVARAPTLAYALGGLGTGIINSVPTLLLLYFATEILHIGAATAALILLVPKLWIIFWEPFVGNWSDRSVTRWGRRRPFLMAGAIILVIAFALLFAPPTLGPTGITAWVAVSYFIMMSGFSLYLVPYVAVPAEIVGGAIIRERMVSWRMTFAMLGALASATVAPVLVSAGGGASGYRLMALVIAPICLAALLMPLLAIPRGRAASSSSSTSDLSLGRQLRRAIAYRPFRLLSLVQIIQVTAVGSFSAGMPFLIINHLGHSSGDIGLAFFVQLAPAPFVIPLFAAAGRRIGHVWGQAVAAAIFAVGTIAVGLLIHIQAPWLLIVAAMPIVGAGFGGMQGQSFVLSAGFIHAANQSSEAGASFSGVWTASEKLGLALGPAATGAMLAILGSHLVLWVAMGPAAMILVSILLLARIKAPA